MSSAPITSVYNDGYIAGMYESFRRDPETVDESWRQFFRVAQKIGGGTPEAGDGASDPEAMRRVAGAAALVQAIRVYGHLAVRIDPLGTPPLGAPELTPEFHGVTDEDLAHIPGAALGFEHRPTAADVVALLRRRYSSNLGFEVTHLPSEAEREWFRQLLRAEELTRPLTPDEKRAVLDRLSEVDGLERFIARAYQGKKRFSIEGTDALVPMLDTAIGEAARAGAREVVIGMAHRGRLNVLTHVLGKPTATLFAEFEGRHASTNAASDTGDVKYHMGYEGTRVVDGREVRLELLPNPSHLEFVNPVINGLARAHQRVRALDRETLLALVGPAEEPLQAIDLAQPVEHGPLLVRRQRAGELFGTEQLPEPFALGLRRQVRDLEAEVRGIAAAEQRDDVGGGGPVLEAHRRARNPGEVLVGDAVELGRQLGRAERRRPQRVDPHGEVPVDANRLHERGRARHPSQHLRIGHARRAAGRAAAHLLRHPEELPPRLVHRRRVAPERLVHLGDVPVVVHAGDGSARHAGKLTGVGRRGYRGNPAPAGGTGPTKRRTHGNPRREVPIPSPERRYPGWRASPGSEKTSGRTSVNVEPLPGTDSSSTRPPISIASRWAM